MTEARVVLQPRRARPFYGRHPWVYPGAISKIEGEPESGEEVELLSDAGHFIARGLINHRSKLRVRLYSWLPGERLDHSFFRARLAQAVALRDDLGLRGAGKACRLVFSEGDLLSGITVDQYDRCLVMQPTSLAMAQRSAMWIDLLREVADPSCIYQRTERGIRHLEGLELQDQLLWGKQPDGPIQIQEAGLRFWVNIAEGQKTGFYIDQRDNRQLAARWAKNRRVLDAFCYTGGFGLYAARAGATEVLGVDSSSTAIDLARENVALNELSGVSFERADVFEKLEELAQAGARFGMVVLDPPKFARQRLAVGEAMKGYSRLQTLGLKLLESGGILVICCCSGLISMPMLEELLGQIAMEARRGIQVLERRGQVADHPFSVSCPESNYLKCLVCRVL